jgi:hypothetical protein
MKKNSSGAAGKGVDLDRESGPIVNEIHRYSGAPQPFRGRFKSIHGDQRALTFWDEPVQKSKSVEILDPPSIELRNMHTFPPAADGIRLGVEAGKARRPEIRVCKTIVIAI